jgi:hypothetical protein
MTFSGVGVSVSVGMRVGVAEGTVVAVDAGDVAVEVSTGEPALPHPAARSIGRAMMNLATADVRMIAA